MLYTVRAGREDDIDRLTALHPGGRGLNPARLRHDFAYRIPDGEQMIFVAELAELMIGYGRISLVERPVRPGRCPSGWYLIGVYVVPGHRNRGIGKLLTRKRLEWLRGRTTHVFMTTMAKNTASIVMHQRLGFVQVGEGMDAPGRKPHPRRLLFRLNLVES